MRSEAINGGVRVWNTSPFSGKENTMDFNVDSSLFALSLMNWGFGTSIQDAFPYLSPEEREFILTGITPKEWNETFSETAQE